MSWMPFSEFTFEKGRTHAQGMKYVRMNFGHIFQGLNYDWVSGKSYAEQVQYGASGRPILQSAETPRPHEIKGMTNQMSIADAADMYIQLVRDALNRQLIR